MKVILKAKSMLFRIVSPINEACSQAKVHNASKFRVWVVGLHLGGRHNLPQHNSGRSPSAAAVAIAVSLANSLDQGL